MLFVFWFFYNCVPRAATLGTYTMFLFCSSHAYILNPCENELEHAACKCSRGECNVSRRHYTAAWDLRTVHVPKLGSYAWTFWDKVYRFTSALIYFIVRNENKTKVNYVGCIKLWQNDRTIKVNGELVLFCIQYWVLWSVRRGGTLYGWLLSL